MGNGTLLHIYGTPIEILGDHLTLEPLIKRNRSNKTYISRLTRRLDSLAHFDIKIKHIARKSLVLTDYLSRIPISKPEPIENYDEEYVISCLTPLLEFINNFGSVAGQKKIDAQTEPSVQYEQNLDQSKASKTNEPKSQENKQNQRSSLLSHLNKVHHVNAIEIHEVQTEQVTIMDNRRIAQIEREDPSEKTSNLRSR